MLDASTVSPMRKRWAALPRGIRWAIGGIAAVVLGLAVTWALFVPAADWLAHHDVGSVTGSLHETAVDNARGRLLTLGAGLFAAGALAYTALTFNLSRQGQVTDRYTKAIEQLGAGKLEVRAGGIYALERVGRDSGRDQQTVMAVLIAFVLERSRERPDPPDPLGQAVLGSLLPGVFPQVPESYRLPGDLQAAVNVVLRADLKGYRTAVILSGSRLFGADFSGAKLSGATFYRAELAYAVFGGAAQADQASFADADLTCAWFLEANLRQAWLSGATLTGAFFRGTDLTGAHLNGAHLNGADLSTAEPFGVNKLAGADLTGATLIQADLTGADLAGATLIGADLTDARWPAGQQLPPGWEPDPGSGLLKRSSAGTPRP